MHDFVDIVHPETGDTARVGSQALRVLAKSGWLLKSTTVVTAPADDDSNPAPEGDRPAPERG